MKILVTILFAVLLSNYVSLGQSFDYKKLGKTEVEIINDLSSTLRDTTIPFVLSPFINYPIKESTLMISYLVDNYGFNINDFKLQSFDTLLLEANDYFQIISPDSLLNWQTIESKDSEDPFINPTLEKLKDYCGKSGICRFHKIVFSEDRKYALVKYWMYCGFMCGHGSTVLMKREDNNWIIKERLGFAES
ncbi:hypothetical protein ACE01N_19505 [Saccharicrinis sp. FJH2]|uniref:hypothetical protein n=1 Tax=Saccharicrinis sp. FJH65 TaxID=3344659 RepID=UPI0035F28B73